MNVNYLVMVQDATVDQVRNDKREVLLDNCEIIYCFILSLYFIFVFVIPFQIQKNEID